MGEISAKIEISASRERVWKIVSDIDNDPEYWEIITHTRNTSKERNVVTREVFLGGDNKCQQRIILFPKEGMHIKWFKGPIAGIQDIMLSSLGSITILEVQMSYTLSGVVSLFSKNAAKYLQKETEVALQLIKEKAEGIQNNPLLEERRLWADLIHDRT